MDIFSSVLLYVGLPLIVIICETMQERKIEKLYKIHGEIILHVQALKILDECVSLLQIYDPNLKKEVSHYLFQVSNLKHDIFMNIDKILPSYPQYFDNIFATHYLAHAKDLHVTISNFCKNSCTT